MVGREYFRSRQGAKMAFIQELWLMIRTRKKYWLMPVIIVAGILGGLIVFTHGSAISPFIYALF
jgi:hypothetical protein